MKKVLFFCCCLMSGVLFGQSFPDEDSAELNLLQTSYDEARPYISSDGKTIYFSRLGHPQNFGDDDQYDIWKAFRKSDYTWGKAIHIPLPINNRADNFVIATSTDGQSIYLRDDSQESGSELVYTKKKGRSWTNPKPVQIQGFSPNLPVSYSMADENEVLLLTIDQDGGSGGRDIYVSTKINKELWSTPQNLGTVINSSSEEPHAVLAADNKTLYFLSNGFEEEDKMTLMVSQREGATWTNWSDPKSTGIALDPILFNNWFFISANGKTMYTSGKHSTDDDQKLIAFSLPSQYQPEPVSLVSGKLIDAETGFELDGNVLLASLDSYDKSQQQTTKRGGRFQFVLAKKSDFNLSAEVPGYFAKSETIADEPIKELDKEEHDGNSKLSYNRSPEVDQLSLRLQKLNSSIQELEQRRKDTQETLEKSKRTNWSPSLSNAQLSAIESKYNNALGIAEEENTITSTGDSELDAMKRAYLKHNKVTTLTEDKMTAKSVAPKENESELDAMKRKFNDANNNASTSSEQEAVVAATIEAEEEYIDFEEFVTQSKSDLEEELSDRVVHELRADLVQEVSFKMHASMDSDSRDQYANTLQKKTANLESEVRRELRKKYKGQVKQELRGEMLEVVEAELRELLREEVKRELRKELEDEVREELRLELEYMLTKEMAKDTQKELNILLKQLKKNNNKVSAPGKYYGGSMSDETKRKSTNSNRKEISLELYPLKTGQTIPLENIFFEANSDIWKEASLPELNRVFDLLSANENLQIEISGHSNGWCSTAFANNISTVRAKAVVDFLTKRGIAPTRLSWKGYGKTQPIVPNDSVANCKKNQRIEMRILAN
ncbi:MAG: OmpA family protein [Saprospiraceae bacterium]